MYLEFFYIILGYADSLTKKERTFDVYVPLIISLLSLPYDIINESNVQYKFIQEVIPFIGSLLGFTLAALSLFFSNNRIEEKMRESKTVRKIRGKGISMYELILVFFSHLIICETILCITYYIASLFPFIDLYIGNNIMNTLFIFLFLHVLFITIRTVSTLYFIATGLK